MKIRRIFIFTKILMMLLTLNVNLQAKEKKLTRYKHKIVKIPIMTNFDTDLKSLPIFFKKEGMSISSSHKMFKVTKSKNPKIKNWDAIPEGTKINLYMSSRFIDPNKYKQYNKMLKQLIIKKNNKLKKIKSRIIKIKMIAQVKESLTTLIAKIKFD